MNTSANKKEDSPRVVTLVSKYNGLQMSLEEGKSKRSRLYAKAPGLEIYLVGTATGYAYDRVNHMMMTMAQSMNIPLVSLKFAGKEKK